jgi:hypothetical protein
MDETIAIQPEEPREDGERVNQFSPYWIDYIKKAGYQVKIVDVWSRNILRELEGCHGLMWRWYHYGGHSILADRLLPVVERVLGIPVFPDQKTCWHYDDKAAQAFLFQAYDIPHPPTYLFFRYEDAIDWVTREAVYPLVLKLASGAGSTNVIKILNINQATQWIYKLFFRGVQSLSPPGTCRKRLIDVSRFAIQTFKSGWPKILYDGVYTIHKGYALFQKFLSSNSCDTRITVVGNRAFAYRRYVRPNDFRASGSGLLDYDIKYIDERFVRIAFEVVKKLGMQSCAIDGIFDGESPVITEISYTYVHELVYNCPGFWSLEGSPSEGKLIWHEGHVWPAEAQAADFLERIKMRYNI